MDPDLDPTEPSPELTEADLLAAFKHAKASRDFSRLRTRSAFLDIYEAQSSEVQASSIGHVHKGAHGLQTIQSKCGSLHDINSLQEEHALE
jgi:hypothetical protein